MSRLLLLVRHAKSSWETSDDDHARPLSKRGQRASVAIGEWIAARDYVPQEVLCSDSERTRETYQRMAAHWPVSPELSLIPGLYHADPGQIMHILASATAERVAIIGHNPGIGALAAALVAEAPDHDRFNDYPTGATTVLRFEAASWAAIGPGEGQVVDFVVPRELD